MNRLLLLAKTLERFVAAIGRASAWAMILLMLVIVADVTLRHWFVIGSTKLQELEWHLHGFLFLMCMGWAYTRDAHVRIELVSERLSRRVRAWIEALGCLLFLLPYVAAVLWFGLDYVGYSLEYDEASASPTGLPNRWIIKSAIVAGFTLLALGALARLVEASVYLFGDPALARKTVFARETDHGDHS